jgi:hypothetical protein
MLGFPEGAIVATVPVYSVREVAEVVGLHGET